MVRSGDFKGEAKAVLIYVLKGKYILVCVVILLRCVVNLLICAVNLLICVVTLFRSEDGRVWCVRETSRR